MLNASVDKTVEWQPSYNIAPGQRAPIIIQNEEEKNRIELAPWGFLPPWGGEKAFPLINARAETVASSRAFKSAYESNRCLVPFTHFYEWKKARTKIPYAIHLKQSEIGMFAGIYSLNEGVKHYAILTTSPNPLMRTIHDRMPVILSPKGQKVWLDPSSPNEKRASLLAPFDEGKMDAFPISPRVNNPRNNAPDLIRPWKEPQRKLGE